MFSFLSFLYFDPVKVCVAKSFGYFNGSEVGAAFWKEYSFDIIKEPADARLTRSTKVRVILYQADHVPKKQ